MVEVFNFEMLEGLVGVIYNLIVCGWRVRVIFIVICCLVFYWVLIVNGSIFLMGL